MQAAFEPRVDLLFVRAYLTPLRCILIPDGQQVLSEDRVTLTRNAIRQLTKIPILIWQLDRLMSCIMASIVQSIFLHYVLLILQDQTTFIKHSR